MLYHSWLALHAVGYSTIESPTWCVCVVSLGENHMILKSRKQAAFVAHQYRTCEICLGDPDRPFRGTQLRGWIQLVVLEPMTEIKSVSFCHFIFVIYLVLKWIDGPSDCMILTVQFWAMSVNIMNGCSFFFPSSRNFFVPQWMVHPIVGQLMNSLNQWTMRQTSKIMQILRPSLCKLSYIFRRFIMFGAECVAIVAGEILCWEMYCKESGTVGGAHLNGFQSNQEG